VAEQVDLRDGTEVELDTASGVLTVRPRRPRRRRKYTLARLLARAKGPNPHGEWGGGGPVGREVL
jgi:antitoxin component of MazEF toxin-antitoxin module